MSYSAQKLGSSLTVTGNFRLLPDYHLATHLLAPPAFLTTKEQLKMSQTVGGHKRCASHSLGPPVNKRTQHSHPSTPQRQIQTTHSRRTPLTRSKSPSKAMSQRQMSRAAKKEDDISEFYIVED